MFSKGRLIVTEFGLQAEAANATVAKYRCDESGSEGIAQPPQYSSDEDTCAQAPAASRCTGFVAAVSNDIFAAKVPKTSKSKIASALQKVVDEEQTEWLDEEPYEEEDRTVYHYHEHTRVHHPAEDEYEEQWQDIWCPDGQWQEDDVWPNPSLL